MELRYGTTSIEDDIHLASRAKVLGQAIQIFSEGFPDDENFFNLQRIFDHAFTADEIDTTWLTNRLALLLEKR